MDQETLNNALSNAKHSESGDPGCPQNPIIHHCRIHGERHWRRDLHCDTVSESFWRNMLIETEGLPPLLYVQLESLCGLRSTQAHAATAF